MTPSRAKGPCGEHLQEGVKTKPKAAHTTLCESLGPLFSLPSHCYRKSKLVTGGCVPGKLLSIISPPGWYGSCSCFLPSFPHLLCAGVLLFSDKGDCTPPASSAIPIGPAVEKRLSERDTPYPLKFPYKSQYPSYCCSLALLRYPRCNLGIQQIHKGFMGCFLPLRKHYWESPKIWYYSR